MPGGLINIATFGSQDLFLTGTPEITYFKLVYRRHTNFSMESIKLNFDDTVNFDKLATLTFPKSADLIHKTYLEVTLPQIYFERPVTDARLLKQYELLSCLNKYIYQYDTLKCFTKLNVDAFKAAEEQYFYDNITDLEKVTNMINAVMVEPNLMGDEKEKYLQSLNNNQSSYYCPKTGDFFDESGNLLDSCGTNTGYGFNLDYYTNMNYNKILYNAWYILQNTTLLPNNPIIKKYCINKFNYNCLSLDEMACKYVKDNGTVENKNFNLVTPYNVYLNDVSPKPTLCNVYKKDSFGNITNEINFNSLHVPDPDILYAYYSGTIKSLNNLIEYFQWLITKTQNEYNDSKNDNYKFAWVKRLGHSIIEYVTLYIGGDIIDKHYGEWIDIWYELTSKIEFEDSYYKMIGNIPELINFDRNIKPKTTIYIPLNFWFTRFNGLALPLVTMQYHDIQLAVKLRKFSDVAYIDDDYVTDMKNSKTGILPNIDNLYDEYKYQVKSNIICDFIYLDSMERRKFAQSGHEYLIDKISSDFYHIKDSDFRKKLELNNPTKEIIWVFQRNSQLTNPYGNRECKWTNYSISNSFNGNPTTQGQIFLNGEKLFDPLNGNYFNYVVPFNYHTRTPVDGINCYSFALMPEEHQPSGSCNMSRLTFIQLQLAINEKILYQIGDNDEFLLDEYQERIPEDCHLKIFTINQNILRIIGGMGALVFT